MAKTASLGDQLTRILNQFAYFKEIVRNFRADSRFHLSVPVRVRLTYYVTEATVTEVHHDLVPELEEVGAAEHNGRIFGTLALGFGPLVRRVTTGRKLALVGRGRCAAVRSGVACGITCAQWKKMKCRSRGRDETFPNPYSLF